MEKKSLELTIAFVVIMVAFFIILAGLGMANDILCLAGFVLMVAAMLYSPLKMFVRKGSKK